MKCLTESDIKSWKGKLTKEIVEHMKNCPQCNRLYESTELRESLNQYYAENMTIPEHKCFTEDQMIRIYKDPEEMNKIRKILLRCDECSDMYLKVVEVIQKRLLEEGKDKMYTGDNSQFLLSKEEIKNMQKKEIDLFEEALSCSDEKKGYDLCRKWFNQGIKVERKRLERLKALCEKKGLKKKFMEHVKEKDLKLYVGNKLSNKDKSVIEAHLHICRECAMKIFDS